MKAPRGIDPTRLRFTLFASGCFGVMLVALGVWITNGLVPAPELACGDVIGAAVAATGALLVLPT